jgi:hypothetical protein
LTGAINSASIDLTAFPRRDPPFMADDTGVDVLPIHRAAAACSLNSLKVLYSYGADFTAVDPRGRTVLHIVVQKRWRHGADEIIPWLIGLSACPVTAEDRCGRTARFYIFHDEFGEPYPHGSDMAQSEKDEQLENQLRLAEERT